MNVEIGAEAALFPEKEYISGIFVAVYCLFNILLLERDGGESGCWEEGAFSRAGSDTVPLITSRRTEMGKEVEGGRQVEGGGNWEISVTSPTRLYIVLLSL
jgi:hypothetical protein